MPRGPQCHQLAIELDRNTAAHHHDHRLSFHGGKPVLEMFHHVASDELDAIRCSPRGTRRDLPDQRLALSERQARHCFASKASEMAQSLASNPRVAPESLVFVGVPAI